MKKLKNVAIIGTGNIGTQIAMLVAYSGYTVMAYNRSPGTMAKTLDDLRMLLEAKNIEPTVPFNQWKSIQESIQMKPTLGEAIADAELIIESIPEKLELKRQVFKQIGQESPLNAILATNSSSLPVSRLEDSYARPERCLNIHFYRPLEGMNMVDIMGGTRTLPEVMDMGVAFIESLGCLPLRVNKEILGFCFNRIWRAVKREALHMWAEGYVDFRDIDRAWCLFTGMKEGPFAIMDKSGLDPNYEIEMIYYNESGDPKDYPPQAFKEKIERGELGLKAGRGFYEYPNPEYLEPGFLKPAKSK